MTTQLNTALQRAINSRNCNEVKILIASGANINHTVNIFLDTMLHKAKNAGIARDILGYSANVNARNLYKQTPLHSAAMEDKAEVVKTLLEHAAAVDVTDSEGLTPLCYAVKSKSVDSIKHLLLLNDARVTSLNMFFNAPSVLTAATLQDLTSVKAVIKYAILRNCRSDSITKSIDVGACYRMENFHLVCKFKNDCHAELSRMNEKKMSDKVTLYEMIVSEYLPLESLYTDTESMGLFAKRSLEVLAGNNYPIYRDIIIEKFRSKLQVPTLRKMLNTVQISSMGTNSNDKEQMTLNQDINSVLAKYLTKNDLFNVILASVEPIKCHGNFTERKLKRPMIIKISAPSTTTCFAKRMKLIKFD